jgi:hypothetical protein
MTSMLWKVTRRASSQGERITLLPAAMLLALHQITYSTPVCKECIQKAASSATQSLLIQHCANANYSLRWITGRLRHSALISYGRSESLNRFSTAMANLCELLFRISFPPKYPRQRASARMRRRTDVRNVNQTRPVRPAGQDPKVKRETLKPVSSACGLHLPRCARHTTAQAVPLIGVSRAQAHN